MRTRYVSLLLALATAACLSTQPKPASQWRNLKVLPQDISHDDLIALMRGWSQSLGVSCDHCHVQLPPLNGRERMDFVTDSEKPKNITRAMLKLTRRMDADVANLARNGGTVTCYTCHRGKVTPDWKLPPQPRT